MSRPEYGETWVYEGIIGAIPGLNLSARAALAVQFLLFETLVLALAWVYDLPAAAVAGTVAVVVATVGSALTIRIGRAIRGKGLPEQYRQFIFGSNVEVVLAVVSYVALVTHLFVLEPRTTETTLLESLLGSDPPVLAVYLTLLILWDVCYRISVGWWASVTALWRSARYRFDAETRKSLQQIDLINISFGIAQLAFVPFVLDHPLLLAFTVGHVVAITLVTGTAIGLLYVREKDP